MAGHDIITGAGKEFFRQIEELKKLQVRIGYQRGKASKTDDDGNEADYCDIAMWNELGTSSGIPSRPFLRNSVDSNAEQIDKACKDAIKVIAKGGKAEVVLKQLGLMQKGIVQQTISSGEFVPNAPSTVRRKNHNGKGSAKPLIDTGGLRSKVNFVICKKGEYD